MTEDDASHAWEALCARYPSKKFGEDTVRAYVEELMHFPLDAAVNGVRALARTSERFPTIAAVRSAIFAEMKEHGSEEEPELSIRAVQLAQWLADIGNPRLAYPTRHNAVHALHEDVEGYTRQELCTLAGKVRRTVDRKAKHRAWLVAAGWVGKDGSEQLPKRPENAFIPRAELAVRMRQLAASLAERQHDTGLGPQAMPEPLPSDYAEHWIPDEEPPF